MDFTIKAVIKNKYLYLRYTYNRKPTFIKISTLEEEDIKTFDSKKGTFKNNLLHNSLIRQQIDYLEVFATKASDKSSDYIKENFHTYIDKKATITKQVQTATKVMHFVGKLDFDSLLKEKKELEERLIEIQKEIFKFNQSGHQTESELQFKMLLDDYPNASKFTKKANANRTISQIKTWAKTLKEFSNDTGTQLSFENMNDEFESAYGNYLMYDSHHKFFNSTYGSHLRKLKTFLTYSSKNNNVEIKKNYLNWSTKNPAKQIVILTNIELEMIWNYKNNLTDSQQKIVDITWFQSWTGLRISDVLNSAWELNQAKQKNILEGTCLKNKGSYVIDLNYDTTGRTIDILKEYNYKMDFFTDKHYNETIKKVLKIVFDANNHIKEDIIVSRYKVDKEFKITKPWISLFSSHCNRKYFINYLIKIGVTEKHILSIIGSASASELQSSYISSNKEDIIEAGRKRIEASKK